MSVDQFAVYDALLHRIYDAALEPRSWPSVLADIAVANQASHALLYTPGHTPTQGGLLFPHNIPQWSLDHWAARFAHEDPFVAAAAARGYLAQGEGVVIRGDELVGDAELLATAFYRDLWAPLGIARVCSGFVFDGTDAHKLPTVLCVYRRWSDPPFDAAQSEILRRLLAHISRSLGVMFHLRDSQLQAASSLAGLDRLGAGVFLLGADCSVQFANAAGQRMLQAADPLRHVSGALALPARLHSMQPAFHRCITEALQPPQFGGDAAHFSRAMVLPDENGGPSCVLHAAPLSDTAAFRRGGAAPRAIVFAYDVAAAAAVPPEKLVALFGLTPAEARAALQVMEGGGGEAMAARLGVSINTFKTQLKTVYSKTGTNRQPDLLKLLLAMSSSV